MKSPADVFRDMAARIERNEVSEFAGALLLVPPDGGDPLEILLVKQTHDLALFWSTITAAVTIAAREFEERERRNEAFRPR
jgi:hypothetical protein